MIEIELRIDGDEVWVTGSGARGERPAPHSLGPEFTLERLESFTKKVGSAIRRGAALEEPVLEEARALHEAVIQGELRDVLTRASGGEPPLVRLMIRDRALQKIPWEALCRPGTSEDFLGAGTRFSFARGVTSKDRCEPRVVEGAIRILAIAPQSDELKMAPLRAALRPSIDEGRIAWLEPVMGERATMRGIFERIRAGSSPHVLHFLGHGGVDESGHPTLRLADDEDGEEAWIKAEKLGQELAANFGDALRLVILEACEGARPGLLGSAAEILAVQAGVLAVVAFLWPVRAEMGRLCSEAFFHSLITPGRAQGDVLASLSAARRSLLAQSAEGFSPVLYLRGIETSVFDFAAVKPGPTSRVKPGEAPFLVPFLKDPRFVGRDAELDALHAMLVKEQAIGVGAITGMGGIGKTQLAVEYAYRRRDFYRGGVYWVNAAKSWQAEFAALAEKVGLREDDAPEGERQRRLARAFSDFLAKHPGALLVFDNVEDPLALQDASLDIVPARLPCRLLFTSRRQAAAFPMLQVRALEEENALRLLLSTPARRKVLEERSPDELKTAALICRTLGCLPLALALGSAYLEKHPRITLLGYLNGLMKQGALVVTDAARIDPRELATQHATALRATLEEQWRALHLEGEAPRVLQTAALLGEAEQVPRARLSLLTGLSDEPEDWREAPLDEALRELAGLSLVETLTEHEIRLHPIVREFAEMKISGRDIFAAACAERLIDALFEMERVSKEIAGRGVDAALGDLRVGRKLAGRESKAKIELLLRPLDREAHCLRRWDSSRQPGFFLQQLRNRCFEMGIDDVRERVEDGLKAKGFSWLCERNRTSRESEELVRTLEGHSASVEAVVVTPDGRFVISGSADRSVKVWDFETGHSLRTFEGHTDVVNSVAVAPDGGTVISASNDRTL